MKIKSLYIKDFKNIKELSLDCDKNLILIQGNTGQGKSAIINALTYILTDSLDDKISEYVRWGHQSFEIKCTFEHKGLEYNYRILGHVKSPTRKTLTISNDDQEYLNSEATKKLAEVIDFDLTKYSAISEQGKTTQLLFQKPAERLKTLKEILKIDNITEIVDKMKEDIKGKKGEIDVLTAELNTLNSIIYTSMEEFELPKISEIKEKFNELEKQKKSNEDHQKMDLQELNSLQEREKYLSLKISEAISIKKQNDLLRKQKLNISEQRENIISKLDNIMIEEIKEIDWLEKEEYEGCKNNLEIISDKIKKLNSDLRDLESGICSKCLRPLGDKTKEQIEEEKIEILKVLRELIDIQTLKKEEIVYWETKIKNYEKQIEINKLNLKIKNDYETQLLNLIDKDKEIQILEEIDVFDKEKELETIKSLQVSIKNRIYFFDLPKYQELTKEINIYDQKVKELENIKKFNEELKQQKAINNRKIKSKEKQIEDLRNLIVTLDKSKDVLDKEFSSYLIDSGAKFLKAKMNEFFQKAYHGRYEITFEQDKNSIDFFYGENGGKWTSTMMASGHEKCVLSIALRVALTSLQGLGILVLDEVDNMASENMALTLFETILNEKQFNQIFVITHCEAVKEMLSNKSNSITITIDKGELK